MYIRRSRKFKKNIKIIYPGEFYVSNEDELIGTLLGSCISVCLYDSTRGIAGMNHYMLPGKILKKDIFTDRSARYGITAINELINEMLKNGSRKCDLVARLFGGGHVISSVKSGNIPNDNIRLARVMMEMEDISIEESDVGNGCARKLLMDVKSGTIYIKRITSKKISEEIAERERSLAVQRFAEYG